MTTEEYILWLPVATSVNAMYKHTSRGVESSDAKTAWEQRAWRLVQRQYPNRPSGKPKHHYRVVLVMHVFLANWRRDISNTVKLTEDLLADYFRFDDRYVVSLQVGRVTAPSLDDEKVHVRLILVEHGKRKPPAKTKRSPGR